MRTRTLIGLGWYPPLTPGSAPALRPTARIAQTDGRSRIAAHDAHITMSASQSVSTMPIASASGPTSAIPIGIRTNDPSVSYEATRDCACSGTCCWKTVNQSVRCTAIPMPPTNDAAAITGVGALRARASVCREISVAARTQTTSGRRGLIRMARMPPMHGADAARSEDHRPRPRTAEPLVGDRRPEDDPPGEGEVSDPEQEYRGPEPRPRGELLPSLPKLVDEAVRACAVARRDTDAAEQVGADEEADRVDRQRDPRARDDDDHAPDRRPEHADHVPRHPLEGVRLLEPGRAHGLRDETDLRGQHQAEPDAVDGLERDDRPHPAGPGENAHSRCRLRSALDERGADEDEVPRDPVGQHSSRRRRRAPGRPAGRRRRSRAPWRTPCRGPRTRARCRPAGRRSS